MLVKITSDDFPNILDKHPKAVWILHPKNGSLSLQLSPTWKKDGAISELSDLYPDVCIFESIVDEELEFLYELGFTKEMIAYKDQYRGFIINLADYSVVRHSIGMCYCPETFVEFVVDLFPELFEPPSEG